ncbi:MAG: hypothetical protein JRI36_13515 [Deltaproteobacteria bacterium]|nr:hypothetical protein [Deltaproteobacteria bacterium]
MGCTWDLEPVPPDGDVDGSDLAEFAAGFALGDYDETDLADLATEFSKSNCLD